MNCLHLIALVCALLPGTTLADMPRVMIGVWQFDPALSRNVGAMAQASVISSISVSGKYLNVADVSRYRGKSYRQNTVYDLTGISVLNSSQIAAVCSTVSRWSEDHLKTQWVCVGEVAGGNTHRVEDPYLADGGTVMNVKSQQAGVATIMAFVRT